ncbi:endolytic transglycosylase MltG [Roseospira goensis]|uniref:Endolytic murein transglycosylase n=1 Tax=Roseospira goensis TaxID=391922 RepID=A0A7W6RYX7_9PROT|nr:endolytic transglycosylase MltG [Roseospira goensis]MBB4285800.1 UPF0755 protein [Roseospira goensis]
MIRAVVTLLMVVAGLAVVAAYAGYRYVEDHFAAPGPLTEPVTVVVPQGAGLADIAARLADAGVVRDPLVFEAGARLAQRARDLKAGEYRFDVAVTPRGALDILTRGDVVARRVTVAEGLTTPRVLEIVREAEGLVGEITLSPDEGTLLPETYHFTLGDTRDDILRRMMAAMDATLAELWPTRAEGLPLETPEEAVILASIVEKETGLPEERAHVAGVFINRLNRGMRLQSDPTVIYGIEPTGALGRPLRRSDLDRATAYNTYVIDGLPPGPICNPGRDAIAAVLNPKETEDLFFVADGSGGHAFARTLQEHNRNVAKWRRFLREQRQQQE